MLCISNPWKICRDWTGDQISLEDILSNSVHCAPFWPLSICPYCTERVDVASITCWIDHFASVHRSLFTSSFTCPACVGIKVCTYGTYVQHWDEYPTMMTAWPPTGCHWRTTASSSAGGRTTGGQNSTQPGFYLEWPAPPRKCGQRPESSWA